MKVYLLTFGSIFALDDHVFLGVYDSMEEIEKIIEQYKHKKTGTASEFDVHQFELNVTNNEAMED